MLIAFGGGTVLVMAIALVASIVPAWRASKIDPLSGTFDTNKLKFRPVLAELDFHSRVGDIVS